MSSRLLWDLSSVLSGTIRLVARSVEAQASRSPRHHFDAGSRATARSGRRGDDVTSTSTVEPVRQAAPIVVVSPLVQHRGESATRQSTAELRHETIANDAAAKPYSSEEVSSPRSTVESEIQPVLSPPSFVPFAKSPSPPTLSPLPLPVTTPSPPAIASIPISPPPPPSFSPSALDSGELEAIPDALQAPRHMQASKVPSTRMGRLFHYGGLAAGMSFGAASEALRRATSGKASDTVESSVFMSEANVRRLVDKLSRMRGAALKLGQFLSIQDSKLLPAQIEQIMMRVQNSANYMPEWQTEKVLVQNLGHDWRTHFESFDMVPFAAASIGQVHSATLSSSSPLSPSYPPNFRLAVKIQFPGVRESISSDLNNLKWLLVASSILPKGLYLENTIQVMKDELDEECDYVREAECGVKMRDLLAADDQGDFAAPRVLRELSGPMVLTTEMMGGEPLTKAIGYDQRTRDKIGESILKLCLREVFVFRFMQTDPNWSNFLFNKRTGRIELIDFGATRAYSQSFVDQYLGLILAAVDEDDIESIRRSVQLGYLTGNETEEMRSAHLASLYALATPFRPSSPNPFPFGDLGPPITAAIRAQIPIMLKHRLTPPPQETYSLNRKLSGAFLLCERLESRVAASTVFSRVCSQTTSLERVNSL